MGVSVRPGKTVVTRTPCDDSSSRRTSAKPRTPDFEATYADRAAASADRVAVELAIRTSPLALRRRAAERGDDDRRHQVDVDLLTNLPGRQLGREVEIDDAGDVEQAVEQPRQNGAEQGHFKPEWACEVGDQDLGLREPLP